MLELCFVFGLEMSSNKKLNRQEIFKERINNMSESDRENEVLDYMLYMDDYNYGTSKEPFNKTQQKYNNRNKNFVEHITTVPAVELDDEIQNYRDYMYDFNHGTSPMPELKQPSSLYNDQTQNFIDHMTTLPENEWDDEINNFNDYMKDFYYGTSDVRPEAPAYPHWKQMLYKYRAPLYNKLFPTYSQPLSNPYQPYLNPYVSKEASSWGSTLPVQLANYGIRLIASEFPRIAKMSGYGALVGLGAHALTYGGLKLYDYFKNKQSKPIVNAGIDVTSKDFSHEEDSDNPTNIILNPSDVSLRAKIKPLLKKSESAKYYPIDEETRLKIMKLGIPSILNKPRASHTFKPFN